MKCGEGARARACDHEEHFQLRVYILVVAGSHWSRCPANLASWKSSRTGSYAIQPLTKRQQVCTCPGPEGLTCPNLVFKIKHPEAIGSRPTKQHMPTVPRRTHTIAAHSANTNVRRSCSRSASRSFDVPLPKPTSL